MIYIIEVKKEILNLKTIAKQRHKIEHLPSPGIWIVYIMLTRKTENIIQSLTSNQQVFYILIYDNKDKAKKHIANIAMMSVALQLFLSLQFLVLFIFMRASLTIIQFTSKQILPFTSRIFIVI